jgi:multiple sugar transport system substrate-binding protein
MKLAKGGTRAAGLGLAAASPMKRRAVATLSVGVVAAMALSACSSSKKNNPSAGGSSTGSSTTSASAAPSASGSGGSGNSNIPATTIKLVGADYGNGPTAANSGQKFWEGIVKDFNAQYPQIKVDVQIINWNDVDNQIAQMVQSGQMPDIAQGSADYAGVTDKVYPVADILDQKTQDNLLSSFADQGKVNGTEYGIPYTSSARALFYNKDLFQKAGISAAPTTWDEYKADAQKLKAAGVAEPSCIPLGAEEAQAETLLWELGNGGGFVDSSGKWALNSQANVDTFTFLQSLVKAGLTEPNPGTVDRTKGCWADFAAGKVGMTNGSPGFLPQVKGKANYGVAPIPGKTGPMSTTLGVCDWIWAFKTDDSKKAAVTAFLSFAMQDKYQEAFDNLYQLLPVTKGATNDLQSNQDFAPFLKALPTATFYPTSNPAWPAVNTQMKQIVGTALNGDPKKVLDQLQQTAQQG